MAAAGLCYRRYTTWTGSSAAPLAYRLLTLLLAGGYAVVTLVLGKLLG
jgi:hypothetical protein